jgi:UDP-N-acetylglucosamine 2-epimerase (non-hydrolysing)
VATWSDTSAALVTNPDVKRVAIVFGTRPEATKLVPVIAALRRTHDLQPTVVVTGQHREQLDSVLDGFGIAVDLDFNIMTERQSLPDLLGRIVPKCASELRSLAPELVVVQGDTMTTFGVTLSAFLEGIPVAHVEAGLRTGDLQSPFPEEASRKLTSVLVDLHLAPTPIAKRNLLDEGISQDRIVVTGQTAVDAINLAVGRGTLPPGVTPGNVVTVTLHRRENWPHLASLASAIARLARTHGDHTFVFPVHLNPTVREAVHPVLAGITNVRLIEPLDYVTMAALLGASRLIVTDSGGLQEEGVTLGIPVAVVRDTTERPEGLDDGRIVLVGTDENAVYEQVDRILKATQSRPSPPTHNPYGDGRASERIVHAVRWRLGLARRPQDWSG